MMRINHLIMQSLKKNIKNYYLYVFALIFSVALYFAFVTLQYDPAMKNPASTVRGSAGLRAGSILLIAIVGVFLLYANTLFIKRRSKEIGLFQLIGMTKGKVFRILSLENILLYAGALIIGIFLGFASSKLIKMVFFKITAIHEVAALQFSLKATLQTIIVFLVLYIFIMIMNYLFIRRQSVLSLFQARSKTENHARKLSVFQMLIGILGIGLVAFGYYLSTNLLSSDGPGNYLFLYMITILGSVIIGTYLFFKGSVSFILQIIRKSKAGYLSINDVLSLSSIMFRMKSNALLLTVITTVSALAIGLLSLSYIAYFSTEKTAQQMAPNDFSIPSQKDGDVFSKKLDQKNIAHKKTSIDYIAVHANLNSVLKSAPKSSYFNPKHTEMMIISDQSTKNINMAPNQTVLTGFSGALTQMISFKDKGKVSLSSRTDTIHVHYSQIQEESILPSVLALGGFPVAVVDDNVYHQLEKHLDKDIQSSFGSTYVGVDITNPDQLEQANNIFQRTNFSEQDNHPGYHSHLTIEKGQKQATGMTMFIVGFLGLTFLITSGCILYFKQMDESEEERSVYTILRKLGFSEGDLLHGIWYKQLFNFGIPLILGLLHSYFAVKSGWFLFGTEMLTPTITVMAIYTILYSIFGVLSVMYYKKVIHRAL